MINSYTIITDNGGGERNIYHDITGVIYTFPPRYRNALQPGTNVIYHRGAARKEEDKIPGSLSDESHYFGTAKIVSVTPTPDGNLRAEISNFTPFNVPVFLHRPDGSYFEESGFFQQGVRRTSKEIFDEIVSASSSPLSSSPLTKSVVKKPSSIGKRTFTTLKIGKNKVFIYNGREYQIVTSPKGYYLKSSDGLYYELKKVSNFDDWNQDSIRVLLSKDGKKYIVKHGLKLIGMLYPISNGMMFEDFETGTRININM